MINNLTPPLPLTTSILLMKPIAPLRILSKQVPNHLFQTKSKPLPMAEPQALILKRKP